MKDETLLKLAKDRYAVARPYYEAEYLKAEDDLLFKIGDQWTDEAKAARKGKPILTINEQPQFVKAVSNEWKQQRPGIKVRPVKDGDAETAKVLAGICRNVEVRSTAELIYDECLEGVVDAGFHYFRVGTQYVDDESFEQEIIIKRIRDRFSVTPDPAAVGFFKEDSRYYFVEADLPKEEFEKKYPDASAGWGSDEYSSQGWCDKDTVKICEYYYVEETPRLIVRFDDGTVLPDATEEMIKAYTESTGAEVDRRRTAKIKNVKWAKITAHNVLEKADIPCEYIPVIPVWGDITHVKGKDHVSGVIRHNKDSARIQNYMMSEAVGSVALAPRRPPVLKKGQVANLDWMWKNWQSGNQQYLVVNDTNDPLPRRLEPDTSPGAIAQLSQLFSEKQKETSGGINKATLGQSSNEKSGVAIAERKQQGQLSSYNFSDNMNHAIGFCGRVILSMIPKVIDSERKQRILGEDGEIEEVKVNSDEDGAFDLSNGKYEFVVEGGASHATRRQELVDTVSQIATSAPELRLPLMPVILKNIDLAGAEEALQVIEQLQGQQQMQPPQITGNMPGMQGLPQ